jgi:hypothetical protein
MLKTRSETEAKNELILIISFLKKLSLYVENKIRVDFVVSTTNTYTDCLFGHSKTLTCTRLHMSFKTSSFAMSPQRKDFQIIFYILSLLQKILSLVEIYF